MLVSYEDITAARSRIREKIHETPCFTSQQFQIKYCQGRNVFFKCDNLQKCGSFKIRGALNAVCKLVERDPMVEAVVTESSGNFGQALGKFFAFSCNFQASNITSKLLLHLKVLIEITCSFHVLMHINMFRAIVFSEFTVNFSRKNASFFKPQDSIT